MRALELRRRRPRAVTSTCFASLGERVRLRNMWMCEAESEMIGGGGGAATLDCSRGSATMDGVGSDYTAAYNMLEARAQGYCSAQALRVGREWCTVDGVGIYQLSCLKGDEIAPWYNPTNDPNLVMCRAMATCRRSYHRE